MPESRSIEDFDWSLTTWDGARRVYLRRWCERTLRERFEALDAMHEVIDAFARMRAEGRFKSAGDDAKR